MQPVTQRWRSATSWRAWRSAPEPAGTAKLWVQPKGRRGISKAGTRICRVIDRRVVHAVLFGRECNSESISVLLAVVGVLGICSCAARAAGEKRPSTASGTLSHESARASYLGDGHRVTGSHDPRRRRIDECRDGVPERGCFLNDRRRILCAAANRIMKVHPSTGPAHGCASSHADDGRPLAWAVAIGCDTASCASRQHRRDQEPGDRATCADEKHR